MTQPEAWPDCSELSARVRSLMEQSATVSELLRHARPEQPALQDMATQLTTLAEALYERLRGELAGAAPEEAPAALGDNPGAGVTGLIAQLLSAERPEQIARLAEQHGHNLDVVVEALTGR